MWKRETPATPAISSSVKASAEMAFDEPERLLGWIHGRQTFIRSARIMTVSQRAAFDSPCCPPRLSRDRTGSAILPFHGKYPPCASLATSPRSCILVTAFDPTAHQAAPSIKTARAFGQHVREDDDARPCLEPRQIRGALRDFLRPRSRAPAAAQKKYDPGATDTEIKIGNIMPYSGPASAYATIGKTEAAYFNKLNAEGGINGRKINFITYDDGYSPPKTVEQARKLVESDEVLLDLQSARHARQQRDPEIHERQEGAAALRLHAARPNGTIRRTFRGPWAGSPTTRPRPASTPPTS